MPIEPMECEETATGGFDLILAAGRPEREGYRQQVFVRHRDDAGCQQHQAFSLGTWTISMSFHHHSASFIRLSQQEAQYLPVDLIAYPEDSYLVVDPYAELMPSVESWFQVLLEAQHSLPRPLGEVALSRAIAVQARYLIRMVVLDFENLPPLRTTILEGALHEMFRHAARLGVRSVCLDRFELLERNISAFKLLKMVLNGWRNAFASSTAENDFEGIIVTLTPGPCWRRFEMAVSHLGRG
jgi:hypothetical protein